MTVPQVAKRLGIHPAKLRRRVKDRIFPPPTYVNQYGLKFFDEAWLEKTKAIIENSFENQMRRQTEG